MSNISTGTVTTVVNREEIVENTSCSTSHLSSMFASFLTGRTVPEMGYQKYFVLYQGEAKNLRASYEEDAKMSSLPDTLIDRIDVRISSTSRDVDGTYYATFVGTFNGTVPHIDNINTQNIPLSLALAAGDSILAFAPFDAEVYRDIMNGSRVEIKWKLQLKHVTTIKEIIKEEENN